MNGAGSEHEVEQLSELLRRGAERSAGEGERRLLRARFLERAELETARGESPFRRLIWAVPALAAVLMIGFFWFSSQALDFEVAGARRDGSYVRASDDRPVTLRFSDDTTVVGAAGSRLRVEEGGARSTRVLLERGRAEVHVVHDALREWMFVAGPFEVLVTGTRFAVEWDPTAEVFGLSVSEGSVEVRGPTGSGPVPVRAGERFHGDALKKSLVVSSAPPETELSPEPPARETGHGLPPAVASPERERRGPRIAKASPPASWQERITRGEFSSIVAEAEARGAGACLSSCGAADLRALSDAARYTGKTALAEQSLLALRQRFGSGAGRDAAFLLGRLFEQRGAFADAERWYQTYLAEAGSGAFAAEALAGKMRVVKKLRGAAAARPLARQYLERFPKGVHVATARELLGDERR